MTAIDRVSIGLRGSVGLETIEAVAPLIEGLGFRALWLSDSAEGDALLGLERAAAVTTRLRLATGVIPLDRRPVPEFAAMLRRLPEDRLTIGIGSGAPGGAVARVTAGIEELRSATEAPVVLGALGPVMRRIAAQRADGVLLNWLTPEAAADAARELQRDREGRAVRSVIDVRTIVEAAARGALAAEVERKSGRSAYAANRERTGIDPFAATIDGRSGLPGKVAAFADIVDEVVLRAITADSSPASIADFARRIAEGLGGDA